MKYRFLLILVFFLYPFLQASAQNKDGEIFMPEDFDHPYITISDIEVSGNKLTKEHIIVRELDFNINDSLAVFEKGSIRGAGKRRYTVGDSSEVNLLLIYSRDNIINTKLFLTVNMYLEKIQEDEYKLKIEVNERHYWWIFPVIKLNAPNFNEWLRDIDLSQLSMGLFFSHNNLFGTSHQASTAFYIGQSWALALGYRIPWIGKGEKKGITFVGAYNNLAVVEYNSVENERQIIYDKHSLSQVLLAAKMEFRRGLYNYNTLKVYGEYISVSDSLFSLNPNYLAGEKQDNLSLSIYVDYYYDTRNNKSYPLEGNMLKAFIDKKGLGILSKDVNLFYYGIDFHFYQKLGKRFYVAEMVKAVNSAGENAPYHYQQSLYSKQDFIRGYDLYTVKGDAMVYFRSNIKYELVPPSVKRTKPGQEKNKFKALQYAFYLNIFADFGYVTNKFTENNPLNNKGLYSWGAGLDFVTYYDMVLRFEYAFNSSGTNGFFFGFGMPI